MMVNALLRANPAGMVGASTDGEERIPPGGNNVSVEVMVVTPEIKELENEALTPVPTRPLGDDTELFSIKGEPTGIV